MMKLNCVYGMMLLILLNTLYGCTGYNSAFYDEDGLCRDYIKAGGNYEGPNSDKRKHTIGIYYIGKRKKFMPFSGLIETDDGYYNYELNGEVKVGLRFWGYNGYSLKSLKYKLIDMDTNEELKENSVYVYGFHPFIKYNSIEEAISSGRRNIDVIYDQELFENLENAELYMEAIVSDGKEEITLKMNKKLHKEFSFITIFD